MCPSGTSPAAAVHAGVFHPGVDLGNFLRWFNVLSALALLRRTLPCRCQSLIQVGDDVVNVLDTNAQPDHVRRYTGTRLFGLR